MYNTTIKVKVVSMVLTLLVLGIMPVSAAEIVEVIYEEPVGWNPFGHSAIRIGDKVYDVSKEGGGTGKVNIRERDYDDVLNDNRGQQTAEVPLSDEQKQKLKENIVSVVGSEFDYNFITNNCADWVENKLRDVGIDIPDDLIQFPEDTLNQVKALPACSDGNLDSNFILHFNGTKYEDSNRDWDGDGKLDGADKNGDPYEDNKIIWHKDKIHAVYDNFDIPESYSLTIEPGVTVMFANEKTLEAEEGDLIAQGTEDHRIVFNKIGTLSDRNFSIEIDDSSGSKFSYCSAGRDVKVLLQDVSLDVDQNIFTETSISISGGTPSINKNTFYDSVIDITVGGDDESSPIIKENTFSGKKSNIIIRPEAGFPVIAENHFSDVNTGIFAWGGSPSIIKNTIENYAINGIDIGYDSSPTITENIISDSIETGSIGILINCCSPTISKNKISNAFNGIHISAASPIIKENTITDNRADGISIWGGSPRIIKNTISDSGGDGIGIEGGSPTIAENSIIWNKWCGISVRGGLSPSISSNTFFENGEDCSKCGGEDQPPCDCWECKPKNGFIAWLMSFFSKF